MAQNIDWSEFKPDAPVSPIAPVAAAEEPDWSQFQPAPEAGAIRKLADVALEVPAGAANAIKAGIDAFGAGGKVAESLGSTAKMYQDMQSPARQFERQAQAQRSQTAEATGSTWEEIKAAGQNFAESPISAMANAAGSVVPIAASVMAAAPLGVPALAVGSTLGLGMGLGAVKSSVYDDLIVRGKAAGLTPEEAASQAEAAQAYFGPNMDQIGVGGVLGILAGTTGIESALGGATSGIRNWAARTLAGMGQEAIPEAAQGGQEKLAANVAAQRAGYDASTWGGVAGQATAEGLASTGPGGVAGAVTKFVDPTLGPISAAARVAQEAQIAGALPAPGQLSGEAAIQMGAEGASRDPSAEYEAQQRNTELQAARAAQEQQRAAVDPAYASQLDGSALPTAAQQTADFQASPSAQVAGVLPAPGQLSGEATIQLPEADAGGDPNTALAAQQRNTEIQAARAAEEQRRAALDPTYASQLDGSAPPAPVDPAVRQQEAIEDVAFANGDDPANVRIYAAQDLPDAPTGSERGTRLSQAQAAVVEGLGRVFGTEYRFYDSPNAAQHGDGFVRRGTRDGVAYIRATEGDAAPLVVAGHETYHGLTPAERAQFSAAIAQHVDVSDASQLAFLTSYTAGRYQAKVAQLVKAGVAETEIVDAILAQAAQDGHADLTREKLREEFDADIFGNRMGDTKFWKKTFELLKQEDRALVVKISDAIKKAIAFLKGQKLRGFDTDRYVKDLEAVRAIAARTLLTAAKRDGKSESGSLSAGTVVRSAARVGSFRSRSTAELTAKMRGGQVVQAGEEFFVERDDGQAGQLDQGRSNRAAVDAGTSRQSDQRSVAQDGAARRDQPSARQGGATSTLESAVRSSAEGAVSLTAVHFSREPRQVLDGRFYGTGLKGAEARRLEGEPDRRLHERVYAYVNEGSGVTAESGVGSYPHALELSNLYDLAKDPLGLRIQHRGDTNALEKAILDQGFAGYYVKGAFLGLKQGAAVVMGKASHALVPKGEVVRSAARTLEKENQTSITVGGKPGEFGWSPAAKMAAALQDADTKPAKLEGTEVPPFVGPTQRRPDLAAIGEAVRKILSAKAARDVLEEVTGAKVTGVSQIAGSWEGKSEPSFVLSGEMTFEQANDASKMLGFLMAQDATVSTQPWVEETEDQIRAVLISQNKAMSAEQVKALAEAARAAGLDYSTTVDGRGAKFLHFGDDTDWRALGVKAKQIADAAGLQKVTAYFVRSNLNEASTYLEGRNGADLRGARDRDGSAGSSDLFRRAVDSILVPYAKAVAAEGYRFSPERYGARFGLTEGEVDYIRAALRPKSGKALSTVPLVTGAEQLDTPRSNLKTKIAGVTKNDLLWALQNRAARAGLIEPSDYSDAAKKAIAESIADEVTYNLGREGGKDAVGWYDAALHKAKTQYERVFPELRTDPDSEMLFDAVLGISSQGNDVHSNAVFAGRMQFLIAREGMTIGEAARTLAGTFGKQTKAIESNYRKLETLLDANGYPDARKFFNTRGTVSEIRSILRADTKLRGPDGEVLSVEGEKDQIVTGWSVFGPKIGSFINSLHGDYSTLTADLWFSRTWNRNLGYVFRHGANREAAQYVTLYRAMVEEARTGKGRDAVGMSQSEIDLWAADPESMLTFAREAHATREKEYVTLKDEAVTPLRQAAKNLIENRTDAQEIPRTDRERAFQQKTVELAQRMVRRKTGVNISIADIQAVLWYHEKELFGQFGVGDSKAEPADYEDAAKRFVDRYQEGELFYVEKPKPRYVVGEKGSYLKDGGVVRSARRAQTETPAFKKWFGEWDHPKAHTSRFPKDLTPVSHAVDEKGAPLVLYHATNNDFSTFEAARPTQNMGTFGMETTQRHGIFMSPDVDFAEEYLKGRTGANVMPVFLDIKSPMDLRNNGAWDYVDDLVENGFDNHRWPNRADTSMWEMFDGETGEVFVAAAKKAGYDGAIMFEVNESDKMVPVYVAFDPGQIKSATGNAGTFDGANPDIRRSARRAPDTPEFRNWFADSKMVDGKGDPIRFMHGSPVAFEAFDNAKLGSSSSHGSAGLGHFFTRDVSTARRYADGGQIYQGWISMARPYQMPLEEAQSFETAADSAKRRAALQARGYDGVVILDDQKKPWAFVAFEPWQFKSADNVGTFDPFKDEFRRSARRAQTETPAFKAWFGDSKVVDADGEPKVVYHGTTNDFSVFNRARANPESDMGAGFYFSNTPGDVASNYAGEGPDLTNRITALAERIAQDEDLTDEESLEIARQRLSQGKPNTLPVFLAIKNPVILGGREGTFFDYEEVYDEELEEYQEPTGRLVDFVDALRRVSQDHDFDSFDVEQVIADIFEKGEWEGLMGPDLVKVVKESEGAAYATFLDGDYALVPSEIIRLAFEEAGFDGVIDHTVDAKFGTRSRGAGMVGVTPDTTHYIAFRPEQIKSASGNIGTFDPENADITRSARRAYADISPEQDAALRAVGLIREPKTVKQRFAELTDNLAKRLTQGIVDQYAPLKDLDFRAYVLSRMSKGSDGTMEAAMYYGTPKVAGDTVEIDTSTGGFMAMLSKLDGEQDRFLSWIAANRAEQLTAEGKEFLFTPDQIRELKNLNQGAMPDGSPRAVKYAQVLREFNGFQDSVLAIAEARGIIDAESRQVWKDGFYVPFYRNMEDGTTGPSVKSGLVNQYAFKKLKGSRRQLNEDLLANTLQNMAHLLSASAKNHAARAALVAAQSAGVAHRVPSGTKGAVRFLEAGRERHYLIDDPFIFDAITSLESVQVVGVEKVLSKFKHWLTMGVTINPVFQLRSLMRDMIASMAVTDIEKNPFANVAIGIKSQLVKDQDYINALASGGLIRFNSLMEGNRADHTRKLIKMGVADSSILDTPEKINHFLTKTLDKYLAIGDISESTNRMALYKQLIAKGVDPLLAAYQARDMMDFSMQGQWRAVRFLTQVVPFLNARLQGLYKLGRDGVVPTGRVLFGGGNATDKQIAKRFSAVTGAVALASILLLEAFGDDEDWKKREDWDRDTYWWFKVGDNAFRIPKPFEVGAIGTVAERGWEYMTRDEMTGARLGARMGHMLASTFALNPTPQAVKPLLDVYANEESFTKKPIESMGMERLKPEDRFTGRTSETAKWLGSMGLPDPVRLLTGEVRPLSPVQIDSLIRGYFSWLGVSATRIVDESVRAVADRPARPEMQLRDVFFAGNFAETLPANSSRYVTALYEQAKEIEFAYASYRYALRTGNTERAQELMEKEGNKIRLQPVVNAAKNAMTKFNENIRIIERDKGMSAAEKRERIDRLKMLQHQVAMRMGSRLTVD